jgi:uracil-DNA glycosylase
MIAYLNDHWKSILKQELVSPYFSKLTDYIISEQKKYTIYPAPEKVFEALNQCSFDRVKVVILGQDPYHNPGEAEGLSFSVPKGIKIPPSLRNIYKELHEDLKIEIPSHGHLTEWAKQGVLLLNATLTVRAHQPGTHQKQGWEKMTDAIISKIAEEKSNCVFFLWGAYAQKKESLIDHKKHLLLKSAHPSPLSAYRGFFGGKHFSQCNEYLIKHNHAPINWSIS